MASPHGAAVRPVTANLTNATDDTAAAVRVMTVDTSGSYAAAGGGTQYTEGATDATITGMAVMWEDAADTLRSVSAAKPLPVGDAGGSLTVDGTVAVSSVGGTVTVDASGAAVPITDNAGSITVDGTVTADAGTGPWPVTDNGSSLTVDGTVAVSSVGGTVTVDLGANNDVTVTSGSITADTELTTADLDTGAGTDTRAVVGLVGSKSGGGALIPGDATAGLKVDLGADNDVTVSSGTITTITNVVHVDDNSGSLTVDGTVTANLAAGTNNIGDVDVLTVPAPLSTAGGGTEATALRVTIASDSTGVVSVDDNGSSLTVDNAGTFAVQDSQVVTDNAAFTDGTTKVQPAGFIYDEVAGTALTENDAAAARITANRAQVAAIEDGTTRGRYATVTASNALKTDGSGVTQPVSGTVTANAGSGTFTVSGTVTANAGTGTMTVDSELPAAAALADATANPTVPTVGAAGLLYNGTTWDRARGTTANGMAVDVTRVQGSVTVTQSTASNLKVDLSGTGANTTALKVDGSAVTQPVSGTVTANVAPATTGGLSISRTLSAASTNGTSVKASAGQVFGWYISSQATYDTFVKLYNKASAPTVGTDTPVMTLKLPPGGVANVEFTNGIAFGTGIAFAITKAIGDSDTTAVAANDVALNLFYK